MTPRERRADARWWRDLGWACEEAGYDVFLCLGPHPGRSDRLLELFRPYPDAFVWWGDWADDRTSDKLARYRACGSVEGANQCRALACYLIAEMIETGDLDD